MFDEWKKRRELRRRIASLKEKEAEYQRRLDNYYKFRPPDSPEKPQKPEPLSFTLSLNLNVAKLELTGLETERLLRKARRLGIEFPEASNWWFDDSEVEADPDKVHFYLTPIGQSGVSRLIREERRKTIEWWVKIITPILSAVIALLGLVVALVSVSKK